MGLVCCLASVALAAPIALVGATLHPVSGPPIVGGTLLIDEGKIRAIGAADAVMLPPDAERVDLGGKVIVPGFVDTHSHVGGGGLNDHLAPVQPGLAAVDAFDPTHVSVARSRAGGITTINLMPGSGKLVGGQTAYLKLRDAPTVDQMLLCQEEEAIGVDPQAPPRRQLCGGVKMANGTNPQGDGSDPRTRMGASMLQRQAFAEGAQYLQAWRAATEGKSRRRPAPPEPDADAAVMAQILAGQRTVHFHTHRADDIITVLRLREQFDFEVVLHHVSEAAKVVEPLAEAGVPCSLIVVDSPGGKEEALELVAENAAVLERAGVPVALHTDDPITDGRLFTRMAGLAVRAGMSEAGALRALTLSGAEMLGLEDRIGSLEVDKDADFVVLSGPPLSVWSKVEQTWVEGERVFDRAKPADRAHALGADHPQGAP